MDLELSTPVAAVLMLVLMAVIVGGTVTSPMGPSTLMMVVPGIVIFGLLTFAIGLFHGKYRAKAA